MFTSRAEYRLPAARGDNADLRLTAQGHVLAASTA